MSAKQDALIEVADIIRRHNLTLDEVARAVAGTAEFKAEKSSGILSQVFGYIGGIFVFAGVVIFIDMQWADLNDIGRVMITLGPGFCAFILALVCLTDKRFEKAATPLFLVAAFVQPTGLGVMLKEFSHGGDPAWGVAFICAAMAIQQGCTFWAKQRTVLALTTTIFVFIFFAAIFDLMHIDEKAIGLVLGAALACVSWSLDHSRHKSIAALGYFCGSVLFLVAAWDTVWRTGYSIVFLGLACGTIFASTVARSRTLLLVGTLALLGFIGDYFAENFADTLGAPVLLVLAGFLLIGAGAAAVKINNRYIKQKV
jgi:hypothetical protein